MEKLKSISKWLLAAVICCAGLGCCKIPDGKGLVTNKYHRGAWVQTIIHSNGKTTWPQMIYWPETWNLEYKYCDCEKESSVEKLEYDKCSEGDHYYEDAPHCR